MKRPATSSDVSSALEPMAPEYRPLFEDVADAFAADDRVVALFVSGSTARGVADGGSDLDLIVTVTDDAHEGFAGDILEVVGSSVDPVITLAIPGLKGSYACTARSGLRVDLVLESRSGADTSPFRRRLTVFDRDEVTAAVPAPDDHPAGPDANTLALIIREFLRQQAIYPAAVVARRDWLLGQEGVHNARQMLYDVLVETNQPLPPMGVKQWSSRLTPDQRTLMASLPLPAADPEDVDRAMHAVRAAFRTAGRTAAEAAGATWPVEVDEAITAYWRRCGIDPD